MGGLSKLKRAQIASWASVAGALALVTGGLLVLLSGEISTAVFACVVVGVAGIGLWIGWAPGEFQAWLVGRQTRFGTTTLLVTILFIGFIATAYVLADRANLTVDLTSVQRYSLNKPTLDTVAQLHAKGQRVRIVGFFSRYMLREQESADLLLRQYQAAGKDTIEIQYIDPDERPDTAEQYGYQPGYDGSLFLAVLGADGKPNFQAAPPLYLGGVNERDITTGLRTIVSAGTFKVYFTVGHGERSPDGDAADETGISRLYSSLIGQGIAAEPLSLLEHLDTGIPEDANAVLIIGASSSFSDPEVRLIADYMVRGGRLAVFADPPYMDRGTNNTFLAEGDPLNLYLWDEFGIRAKDEVVAEPDSSMGSDFTFLAATIAPHQMLADVRDAQIVMRLVRTLDIAANPTETQAGYIREPLLLSSESSFSGSGLEQYGTTSQLTRVASGPQLLAVTARRSMESQLEAQPRVILIGDSDAVKNEYVKEFYGNAVLWTDVIDWLTGFVRQMTFSPVSDPTQLNLVVTDAQRTTISYITLLVLPGIVLLSGVVVWWFRRR